MLVVWYYVVDVVEGGIIKLVFVKVLNMGVFWVIEVIIVFILEWFVQNGLGEFLEWVIEEYKVVMGC